jgi:hypothetical protein
MLWGCHGMVRWRAALIFGALRLMGLCIQPRTETTTGSLDLDKASFDLVVECWIFSDLGCTSTRVDSSIVRFLNDGITTLT